MIVQILSICMAGPVPDEFHSIADMICPAGSVSCLVALPDWVYRVQGPAGSGEGWSAFTRNGDPLPWRSASRPGSQIDTLLLPRPMAGTDSGWVWDAQGRFPVVGAFLGFDTPGASGKVVLEFRDSLDRSWSFAAEQTCWYARREGGSTHQDTLRLPGEGRHRFWRVRPVGSKATLGAAPRLVLVMHRDVVEVATGGADTMVWAAGLAAERMRGTPAFPETKNVEVREGRIASGRLAAGGKAWERSIPARTWVLWSALIGFLTVLAFLAMRLLREAFRGTHEDIG